MIRRLALSVLGAAAALALTAPSYAANDPLPVGYNFLTGVITGAGTANGGSAPGTNDWSCQPSKAHPRPVVLVHGTFGNRSTNWQTYGPLLHNNGYCVFALTYGVEPGTPPGATVFGGMAPMEQSAKELKRFVAKVLARTGASKVDLVGHSQGTLMPNYYVKFLGGARYVHDYISLSPLWHGTTVANPAAPASSAFGQAAPTLSPADYPVCHACAQFAPGSAFLTKMRAGGVAVKGVHYTNIVTQYDELVQPYTSGIEKGMTNIVVQSHCDTDYTEHFEMAADPVAAGYVLNALDPAHPTKVPCTVVLPFEGPVPGTP